MSPTARARTAGLTWCLALAACAATSPWDVAPQPVVGLPEMFVLANAPAVQGQPSATCRSPLRDPRNTVVLTMVRSGRPEPGVNVAWGDYAVSPSGSYGLAAGELLRVECGSGRPVGRVPRD